MKIFHHNDDDGRCAAAIVNHELAVVFDKPEEEDFIEYYHGCDIKIPENIKEGETVYIVDLALDSVILEVIRSLVTEHNCHVVHIDHHKTTLDNMKMLSEATKTTVMDKVIKFYKVGISGALLTWIYSCMDESERLHPESVEFDFSDKRTHVAFNYDTPNMREYRIPMTIRFVDDNDVWLHEIPETKYFCKSLMMFEDKRPFSDTWRDLIYGSDYSVYKLVENGELLYKYQETVDKFNLSNAFETELEGLKVLCLNTCCGNSNIFGEKFDQYPCCIKFSYDGRIHMWRYTMYGSKKYDPDESIDLSGIARKYGGGGHAKSCGFQLPYNLFGDDWMNGNK